VPDPLLETRELRKRFGGSLATDSVSITLDPGELHAVIGPNGAGKTTLVAQLAGELAPDHGAVLFAGDDVTAEPPHRRAARGLIRSFQVTSVFPDFTALDNVAMAVLSREGGFHFWRPARRDRWRRWPRRGRRERSSSARKAGSARPNRSSQRTMALHSCTWGLA